MPRFIQRRYRPAQDSTPDFKEVDLKRVVLFIDDAPDRASGIGCPCGCGETPKGPKAVFAMGHDARLRGKLIRAHLTDTEIIELFPNSQSEPLSAVEIAGRHGWRRYLDEAIERREEQNRAVLQRALGSSRLIKVGRWEYTGQVAAVYSTPEGDEYEIEYVTKSGHAQKTRVPADEAPLATES